jgi:hypothetical protein
MLHRSKRRNGIEQINIAYAMINYYKEKASTIKKWVPFAARAYSNRKKSGWEPSGNR